MSIIIAVFALLTSIVALIYSFYSYTEISKAIKTQHELLDNLKGKTTITPPKGGTGERSPGPVYSSIHINIKEVVKMVVDEVIREIKSGEIRII